ncbi:tyrosine-type recombinase/integrase [Peredibacter sp. HCB2-198]|uniref:tyrosine-type recombinase/integrase n=1 Tax=Peredibacter sp. HCB2-198 TaxID=3383025 RepID=UPI0038B68490
MNLEVFSDFKLTKSGRVDRNKLYYGFIHNFSSEHTRDAYTRDLRKFLGFLQDHFRFIDETRVEHAHVVAFKDLLLKEDYSPRSVNRILATLWSFYDYLMDLDLIEKNPVARVKRFSIPKEVKTQDLSDEEVVHLLAAINTDLPSGKLHKAILTLFFTTGMRHREVSHLQFKNLDEQNGFTVVKYFAKGHREMITPLNPKAEAALSEYLQWAESAGYSMTQDDYIFRGTKNNVNRPLDPKTLNYIIKRYAKMIGVRGDITIHSARSTVIGMLLDKGHALERVADFVGHRDISMTKAYNKRRQKIHQSLSLDL